MLLLFVLLMKRIFLEVRRVVVWLDCGLSRFLEFVYGSVVFLLL